MVDQAVTVWRTAQGLGGGSCEAGRFDVVAVCGETLESIPQRGEWPHIITQADRVRIARDREVRDDRLPQVVMREAARCGVSSHRVEAELERDAAIVLDEPGLRAVDVAVDRGSEVFVEAQYQFGRDRPDRGRNTHRR